MPTELANIDLNYWILQTIAMMITAFLLPGLQVKGPVPAFLAVAALAFVNSKVWDAALFFSVPDHLSMQVLSLVLTNGLIFWLIVKLLPGIETQGVFPAIAAPLIFSVCSMLISTYGKDINWIDVGSKVVAEVQGYREQLQPAAHPLATPARAVETPQRK